MIKIPNTKSKTGLIKLLLISLYLFPATGFAEDESRFNGVWIFNQDQSDKTDKQIERAIKDGGGKVRRPKRKGKYLYKGGPKEQELYDRISYDETLDIRVVGVEFHFIYKSDEEEGEFERRFYSDNRGRSVSAKSMRTEERQDFSFASMEGDTLVVESRVRDGGRTTETYSLEAGGNKLRVVLHVEPLSFLAAIDIVRVFDRKK